MPPVPMAPRLARSLTLAVLLAGASGPGGAAGCASADPIVVPLVYEREDEPDLIENAIPLLLSGWTERPREDEVRGYALWPLWHYVREGPELQVGLLGANFIQKRLDHRGFLDVDYLIPPVLYGHSVDEGSYFALLPFGGTTKGLLGKSFAAWVLFPLYLYTEDNRGTREARAGLRPADPARNDGVLVSHHVLFPFVNWLHGHGRSGFRIFPFYAHYEREDLEGRLAYERTWILWPFWTHQRNNLNSPGGPQTMWFLFPFFGRSEGQYASQWTVLWPIVRYFEYRRASTTGPLHSFRVFPFFAREVGRYRTRLDIWPFWGRKERFVPLVTETGGYDRFERTFILWPVVRWENHESDKLAFRKWWVMPLLWSYETEDKVSGAKKEEFKVWPLFRYKSWPDGRVTVNLFSPLWFNDPEGAFEMIYNPLFRIYERSRQADGDERRLYAWGLVQDREGRATTAFTVHPFLYWNDVAKDGSARHDRYLFGLFQYRRAGAERALRFFWLPEISWRAGDD